ncbi:MAG: TIGR01777 family protein [Planctomycetia bacterium]|nr:TIGR01777 family protein [Planctomycetia bacterium]
MKALVTGATGFVGPRLLRLLDRPVALSRDPDRARARIGHVVDRIVRWDPLSGPPPPEAFEGVDTVLHLAGESVAEGRWTAAQKARIRDSRVIGTRNLVQGIVQAGTKPRVLVSASAVGYYGDRGDEELTESAPPASDFLAQVCVDWEREALAAERAGVRVALARTGIVLGAGGGALAKMLLPFKLGAGGPLGSGRQWMPWIHVADLARLYLHAAETSSISGPMNAVAPNPVRNSEFTQALGRQLHRPAFMPAPYLGLRLVFGEFAQVLFASQRVVPKVALDTGFVFQYPELAAALREILAPAA